MDFAFSEEQNSLRREFSKLMQQRSPLERVRAVMDSADGFDRSLWKDLAGSGFVGLRVHEEHGGGGLDFTDLTVLLEEAGRVLLPSPLLSTNLAIHAIASFGNEAQKRLYLPGLADGSRIGTLAVFERDDSLTPEAVQLRARKQGEDFVLEGTKHLVSDVAVADVFVVAFRSGEAAKDLTLCVVEKGAGAHGETQKTVDRTKRMGNLQLDNVRISPAHVLGEVQHGWPSTKQLLDIGALLVCAESIGAAEALHAQTVEYAKTRVQFEHVIGKYQSVKHPLAEMYVDLESTKSLTYYAAWLAQHDAGALSLAVSRAKAYLSDAFARLGTDAIQLHGAIGYTWELDVQMFMKRARWARPQFGDSSVHYERVARLGGL
jgi:alkylation response protein AidB-like acyl-CoA dehydrogenase